MVSVESFTLRCTPDFKVLKITFDSHPVDLLTYEDIALFLKGSFFCSKVANAKRKKKHLLRIGISRCLDRFRKVF